ncbi:hypothetical protein HMN09_00974500 [Mycena chlorophos]|uniref:WD40 repeat-like protein n=1 Tax=Mycena chlorophos TaxID=658473 RepID=A0A8H6SHE8_MYCCL|nr:hypothetical protein HMN09_00974500 [Mycena chlorophos]
MPRDLPGFYWDAERNRYFPITTAPQSQSRANLPPAPARVPTPRKRKTTANLNLSSKPDESRSSRPGRSVGTRFPSAAGMARVARSTRETRFADTPLGHHEPIPTLAGSISAFGVGPARQYLGDTGGWLYSRTAIAYPGSENTIEWMPWTAEFCLAPNCEVSAICTTSTPSGTRCVAASFGPKTKICIQDADAAERMSLLSLSTIYDVRCASLFRSSLLLGAARGVAYLSDLETSSSVRHLPTEGDVFAVAQKDTLVYAGTRNGSILRFDTRLAATSKPAGQLVTESIVSWASRNQTAPASTANFVHPMQDGCSLVVGYMDGRLGMMDTRFLRPQASPVVVYSGHVGSVSTRLGITLDPTETFLFAGGADCRLRGWSVRTGTRLLAPSRGSPFSDTTTFSTPLLALEFEDGEDLLPVLWTVEGGVGAVWRWRLGGNDG